MRESCCDRTSGLRVKFRDILFPCISHIKYPYRCDEVYQMYMQTYFSNSIAEVYKCETPPGKGKLSDDRLDLGNNKMEI